MRTFEALQNKKGTLIKLKSMLYWYGGVGLDNVPSRICILIDSAAAEDVLSENMSATTMTAFKAVGLTIRNGSKAMDAAAVCLLIDGQLCWVWATDEDMEFL